MNKISVKAIILRKNKVLLLRPRHLQGSFKGWDGPGGHIEQGESIFDALKREIFEETRLSLEKAFLVKLFGIPSSKTEYLIFLCTVSGDKVVLSKEHSEFKWVSTSFFRKLVGSNLINELLETKRLIEKITSNNIKDST